MNHGEMFLKEIPSFDVLLMMVSKNLVQKLLFLFIFIHIKPFSDPFCPVLKHLLSFIRHLSLYHMITQSPHPMSPFATRAHTFPLRPTCRRGVLCLAAHVGE